MRTKRIIINHTDNILKYRANTLQLDRKKKKIKIIKHLNIHTL